MNVAQPTRLASERVVIAAPLSFAGSAARIRRIAGHNHKPAARLSLGAVALLLIVCAWTVVLGWYLCFSFLLVPYRVTRRGQRKRKREALMHREQIAAIQSRP